jgi:dTDP-4-amino-4,6-dideoxygalactose transaminase
MSQMDVPFLDLKRQRESYGSSLEDAVLQVLRSCQYVGGPDIAAFEKEFADYIGVKHCVTVSNGTAALELALRGLGIGPGDEAITVPNTFIATVSAIYDAGATPVLAEADPKTYTMDPATVKAALTPRTKAIIPVHLYGQPCDMDELTALAQEKSLLLVEDACQAHGASYKGRRAGSFGDAAAFSFYPGKNLGTVGDGGAVVTNDDGLAAKLRLYRDHGRQGHYGHVLKGGNYRLDTTKAAALRVKLPFLDRWNMRRADWAQEYWHHLAGVDEVVLPAHAPDRTHIYHLFVIQAERRDDLQKYLKEQGIATGIHYPTPVHQQPGYPGLGGPFPHTEAAAPRLLSLPMFAELREEEVRHVADTIREFYAKK